MLVVLLAPRADVLVESVEHETARTFAAADLFPEGGPHPCRSVDPASNDASAREMLPFPRHFLIEEQKLAGRGERIAQRAMHALRSVRLQHRTPAKPRDNLAIRGSGLERQQRNPMPRNTRRQPIARRPRTTVRASRLRFTAFRFLLSARRR